MSKIHLEFDSEQAEAIISALDLFARISVGQIEEIAHLARTGRIAANKPAGAPSPIELDGIEESCRSIKTALGYSPYGAMSIENPNVPSVAYRCFALKRVIEEKIFLKGNTCGS